MIDSSLKDKQIMRVVLCLDYSSFTEKILTEAKRVIEEFQNVVITVLHVIDESLFFPTTGFETELGDSLAGESRLLKEMCKATFGEVNYIEDYGIPNLKLRDLLNNIDYDLLVIGSHSRHGLEEWLVGGTAEYLLQHSTKPVLVIP